MPLTSSNGTYPWPFTPSKPVNVAHGKRTHRQSFIFLVHRVSESSTQPILYTIRYARHPAWTCIGPLHIPPSRLLPYFLFGIALQPGICYIFSVAVHHISTQDCHTLGIRPPELTTYSPSRLLLNRLKPGGLLVYTRTFSLYIFHIFTSYPSILVNLNS